MKTGKFSKVTFFFLLVIGILVINGCSHRSLKLLRQHILEIEQKYAPDKRTSIFHAEIRKDKNSKRVLSGETLHRAAAEEITGFIERSGIKVADSLTVLPHSELGDKTWGLICVSVANIRSRPSHPAELVNQAVMGNPVRVLKKQSGWLLIQTPDNYIGWTTTSSVHRMSEEEMNEWRNSNRVIFENLYGNVVSLENKALVVSDLVAGAIVVVVSENDNFFEVKLPDGRMGLVNKSGFSSFRQWALQVEATPGSIISTALKFSGLPYLWGGASSKALDCSGFTRTVYFLNGLILERDASQQIRHGSKVSPDNNFSGLQPGDLLFYGRKEPLRVVHVGIWMGNTHVIHASGIVKTESMDRERENFSDYLYDTFLGEVRRIIGYVDGQGIVKIAEHPWYF